MIKNVPLQFRVIKMKKIKLFSLEVVIWKRACFPCLVEGFYIYYFSVRACWFQKPFLLLLFCRQLTFWNSNYSNSIVGSDGSAFHPLLNKNERIYIFTADLCRYSSAPQCLPAACSFDVVGTQELRFCLGWRGPFPVNYAISHFILSIVVTFLGALEELYFLTSVGSG